MDFQELVVHLSSQVTKLQHLGKKSASEASSTRQYWKSTIKNELLDSTEKVGSKTSYSTVLKKYDQKRVQRWKHFCLWWYSAGNTFVKKRGMAFLRFNNRASREIVNVI